MKHRNRFGALVRALIKDRELTEAQDDEIWERYLSQGPITAEAGDSPSPMSRQARRAAERKLAKRTKRQVA